MSVSASKGNKRTAVYLELKEAQKQCRVAMDSLVTTKDALAALQKTLGHAKQAARMAGHTRLEWEEQGKPQVKVKRDALPTGIRRSIATEQAHLQKLMERVKAIPVTKDQTLAAKAEKARHKKKIR